MGLFSRPGVSLHGALGTLTVPNQSNGTGSSTGTPPSRAILSTMRRSILLLLLMLMGDASSTTSVTKHSRMVASAKGSTVPNTAPTLTGSLTPSRELAEGPLGAGLAEYERLFTLVQEVNACELPGCTIKYGPFNNSMWRAVERGFVTHDNATFCAGILRYGATCGIQVDQLRGQRIFRNYSS